jgi:hypothetical protein
MHSDDEGVGRILGRRQALTILGMSGLALTLAGTGTAAAERDPGSLTRAVTSWAQNMPTRMRHMAT